MAGRPPRKIQNPKDSKNYLFAIGIDNYESAFKLHNCVRDVKKFAEVLTTKYQFNYENVILLLDEQATRKNIYGKFEFLINEVTDIDTLVIYFAGIGGIDNAIHQGHWAPVDVTYGKYGEYGDSSTIIEFTSIKHFVKHIKAKHIAIISDSPNAGLLLQI